ncbi:hypothetical protein ACQY0O_000109 [Thecaphora frezii]
MRSFSLSLSRLAPRLPCARQAPTPLRFATQPRTFVASAIRPVQPTEPTHALDANTPPSGSTPTSSAAGFKLHQSGPATPTVKTDETSRSVYVTWASGVTSKFHNIWLRDHCRCSECYHPKTKQRLLNTFEIPADIAPRQVESTTEGLLVHWPPLPSALASSSASSSSSSSSNADSGTAKRPVRVADHASLYPWRWLMNNSYSPVFSDSLAGVEQTGSGVVEKVLWGKGIGASPPTVRYEEVMESEEGVWKWLTKVAQYGFCFVQGVPPTPTDTENLVRRIAFIRETHYGGFWDFTSDLAHGDTAYTDLALQAHTDTTYFTDPAGLQLFHLLSHTASKSGGPPSSSSSSSSGSDPSGGESLLVDGFLAAQVLGDVDPQAYATLSRVKIRTHSAGDEEYLIQPLMESGYPILQHDEKTGVLRMVRYNNDDRSVLRLEEEEVEEFYRALRRWNEVVRNPEGEFLWQLKPGTALSEF